MSLLGFEPKRTGFMPILRGLDEQSEETLSFSQAFSKRLSEADYAVRYITGPDCAFEPEYLKLFKNYI